jgi:hypothetical protein
MSSEEKSQCAAERVLSRYQPMKLCIVEKYQMMIFQCQRHGSCDPDYLKATECIY